MFTLSFCLSTLCNWNLQPGRGCENERVGEGDYKRYIGWEGETEENVCDVEVNLFDTDVVL